MRDSVIYQDILAEGRAEGLRSGLEAGVHQGLVAGHRQVIEQERALLLRQLARKIGTLPEALGDQVKALSVLQWDELGEALLSFEDLSDLENWLEQQPQPAERVVHQIVQHLDQLIEPGLIFQIQALPLEQLDSLAMSLADFSTAEDLSKWLNLQAAAADMPGTKS
ncbi:MAG: DUF4351 domain-containing protein [Cyanobacteria bacterium J06648_16]